MVYKIKVLLVDRVVGANNEGLVDRIMEESKILIHKCCQYKTIIKDKRDTLHIIVMLNKIIDLLIVTMIICCRSVPGTLHMYDPLSDWLRFEIVSSLIRWSDQFGSGARPVVKKILK